MLRESNRIDNVGLLINDERVCRGNWRRRIIVAAEYKTKPASSPQGIYDVPEVARYLRATSHAQELYPANSRKLIGWIRRGLASPELSEVSGMELLIAFEDLVSMRVIVALRAAGVSWMEIRATNQWLRDQTGHPRPFATELLWTGQGQMFVEWTERLISGSRNGQMAFDVLRQYLILIHGLKFGPVSQVAISWEASDGVVLEPDIQFGAPCIKGTRIPTRTIVGMVEAGDSPLWVAQAYGISSEEVQAALDWESRLRSD